MNLDSVMLKIVDVKKFAIPWNSVLLCSLTYTYT